MSNPAEQPPIEQQIAEQEKAADQYLQIHEDAMHDASRAEMAAVDAELERSAIAAHVAAVGVNATVMIVDRVASVGEGRATAATTSYNLPNDHFKTAGVHASSEYLAPAWSRVFMADRNSPAADQRDQHSTRHNPSGHHEIHDHGRVIGRIARGIRRGFGSIRENKHRRGLDEFVEEQPMIGTLARKLDEGHKERTAPTNISEAVALAAGHIEAHVKFAATPEADVRNYFTTIANLTPEHLRARAPIPSTGLRGIMPSAIEPKALPYIHKDRDTDIETEIAPPQELAMDKGVLMEKHLASLEHGHVAEGRDAFDLAFHNPTGERRKQLEAESREIGHELALLMSENENLPEDLEREYNRLSIMLGYKTPTKEEQTAFYDSFTEIAARQIGTIAMRHAVRGGISRTELLHSVHGTGGLREQREQLMDIYNRSQLPGFNFKEYAADSSIGKSTKETFRSSLVQRMRELDSQIDSVIAEGQQLNAPQSAILPAERRLIPEIVAAATGDEYRAHNDIVDHHLRARQERARHQAKLAEATQAEIDYNDALDEADYLRRQLSGSSPRP